ncbi:putative iron-regulated protein [Hasllibacter halocynthiae]|uniref:Putative iron-regulated protein n=1 Tax=Hasllibacter halocynthiae TaxID=595589 RepID=A0A2T0X1Y9_9RHOB|nr:putative iron-regulated protein [Hasllibacter halocynthiae]
MTALAAAALLAAPALAERIGPAALDAAPEVDVLIVGEAHDNPAHHLNQARAAAHASAVVWEMLTPDMAAGWDPALLGDLAALDAALGWSGAGWPDVAGYAPILEAARAVPQRPGGVPPADVRRAAAEGAAPVFGEGARRFGLADPFAPARQAREVARQAAAHCGALPEDLLPGMVEVQRLRDAALARAAIDALDRHGPPVLVIAGNGHAEFGAVPEAILRADPEIVVRTVGQLEAEPEEAPPFDRWILTDAPGRDDPCEAFQ